MPKNQLDLHSLSINQLHEVKETLETFLFSQKPTGEQYHPDYRKNRESYKKLIRTTVKLKSALHKYFKSQWDKRDRLINLYKFTAADESDYLNIVYWEAENKEFVAQIEMHIGDILSIGAAVAEKQFNLDIGVDKNNTAVQQFLRDYTLKLGGKINNTTKKRIMEQIKTSLKVGESRDKLVDRLKPIISDEKRAVRIAQTESIRAYSEGGLAVARRIGLKTKRWAATVGPCPVCTDLDNQVIGVNENFSGGLSGPPAHPNCKCLLKFDYNAEKDTLDWKNTGVNLQDYQL